MRDPNSWDSDPTRHGIYFDFDNGCRIGICGRRPYAAAFVKRGRFRRRIRAYRANRAEASFRDTNSLFKGDAFFGRNGVEYALVSKAQPFFGYFEFFCHALCNDCFSSLRCLQRCISCHQRHAA